MKSLWCAAAVLMAVVLPRAVLCAPDDALAGSRSYAMGGAARALSQSNDALVVNPAGMAIVKGYGGIDFHYAFTNIDNLGRFGVSIVDAKSSSVAGGFALTYERGRGNTLTHLVVGAAYPVTDSIDLGASLHNLRGTYRGLNSAAESVNVYTGDVGLCLSLGDAVHVGAAYNNIVKTDKPELTPATVGFGGSVDINSFVVAVDMTFDANAGNDQSYHVGGEYVAANTVPVRLGWTRQRYLRASGTSPYENLLSVGLGWTSQTGSLEASCRRSLDRGGNWGCLGAIKLGL